MSDEHKTLLGAARQPGDAPGGADGVPATTGSGAAPPAAAEPAPGPAPPLVPLPEPVAAGAALADQGARSCHLCGASEHERPLKVMNGTPGLVRCAYVGCCIERYGARRAAPHRPGAGTAEGGPTPPVPAPAPPPDSGAGVCIPPAAPAPDRPPAVTP